MFNTVIFDYLLNIKISLLLLGTPAPPPPIRQLIRPDGSLNDEDHNSPNNEIDRHLNNKYQESRNGPQSDQQFNTHVPPPGYSMGSSTGNIEQVNKTPIFVCIMVTKTKNMLKDIL